jgi:NAD+ synthase (glutamine-hydrolysing)
VYDSLHALVDGALKSEGSQFSRGQLRSYMRTPVNYYVAQVISQTDPCVVLGTGNKDEDGFLGYFCKAGDGVVDVQLIADLHKSEVFAVAKHLGVPDSIVVAPPSADLWPGQTDENEMGFSYDFVELFTTMREKPEPDVAAWLDSIAPEARAYYEDKGARANAIHARNAHKFHFPVNINVL